MTAECLLLLNWACVHGAMNNIALSPARVQCLKQALIDKGVSWALPTRCVLGWQQSHAAVGFSS